MLQLNFLRRRLGSFELRGEDATEPARTERLLARPFALRWRALPRDVSPPEVHNFAPLSSPLACSP